MLKAKQYSTLEMPEFLPLGEMAFNSSTHELYIGMGENEPIKKVTDSTLDWSPVDYFGNSYKSLKERMDSDVEHLVDGFSLVEYTGSRIHATNTIEKQVKSAILSGSTKYRDIDTGEFLETFEEGRNLELVSVKMPVLTTSNEDGTKTNILTVNEEVELRGIGDVRDELNLLTGELTQRVGEVIFDGSENWSRAKNSDGTYRFGTVIDNMYNNKLPITPKNIFIKADKLPIVEFTGDTFPTTNSISAYGNIIVFYIDEIQEISDFKAWLSQNPTTVQYQLATESIKTVDLITVDQDGQPTQLKTFNDITHVELSSEGLIPEVELEVATKINETLLTMSPQHHDISETQNKLGQTIDEQTENTDAAMLATTEIYEQTL